MAMKRVAVKNPETVVNKEYYEISAEGLEIFEGKIILAVPTGPKINIYLTDEFFGNLREQGVYLMDITIEKMLKNLEQDIAEDCMLQYLAANLKAEKR